MMVERSDVPAGAAGPPGCIRLPAVPASAAAAREFVKGRIDDSDARPLEQAAPLCVTGPVANVVVHKRYADRAVAVRSGGDELTVEVSDYEGEVPVSAVVSWESEHGRGLQIVECLDREWGVTRTGGDGKCVWFRLREV